jgi:hypothetical protein
VRVGGSFANQLADQLNESMDTLLMLAATALLCFVFFYKAIDWFENI